jgi:hypothetical protein
MNLIIWIIIGIVILLSVFFIGYVYGKYDNDKEWKIQLENWKKNVKQ